jgi:hypothetical protein
VSIHDAAAPALDTGSIRTVESSGPKPIDPRGAVSVNGPLHGFGKHPRQRRHDTGPAP